MNTYVIMLIAPTLALALELHKSPRSLTAGYQLIPGWNTECDTGRITSGTECALACKTLGLGLTYAKALSNSNYPPGCWRMDEDDNGNVFFNINPSAYRTYMVSMICGVETVATPSPSPSTPPCDDDASGTCTVSEDPHIEVFDGGHISLIAVNSPIRSSGEEGVTDKWLVRSGLVSIQARFVENADSPDRNMFVRAIAVSGAFLNGGTLVIGSHEDQITWNGSPVLVDEQSTFEFYAKGIPLVKAVRGQNSCLVQDLSKRNPGVHVSLPLGVRLIVNRLQNYLNIAIQMTSQTDGQEGLCGNFNGVSSDDSLEFQQKRYDATVTASETLFAGYISG